MAQTRGMFEKPGEFQTLTGHRYNRLDRWCPFLNEHCRDDCALLSCGYCAIRLLLVTLSQQAIKHE